MFCFIVIVLYCTVLYCIASTYGALPTIKYDNNDDTTATTATTTTTTTAATTTTTTATTATTTTTTPPAHNNTYNHTIMIMIMPMITFMISCRRPPTGPFRAPLCYFIILRSVSIISIFRISTCQGLGPKKHDNISDIDCISYCIILYYLVFYWYHIRL